jgi:hypothetical protein
VVYKGEVHEGEHDAIIDPETFEKVHVSERRKARKSERGRLAA